MYKRGWVFIVLLMVFACKKNVGFFREMPSEYSTSSIDSMTEIASLFKTLKTARSEDGNTLTISGTDCGIIPLCGQLIYRNDTLYYKNPSDAKPKLFAALNGKRYTSTTVAYSDKRADEVTFLGNIYREANRDSVLLIMLQPKKEKSVDGIYLKFICLKKDDGLKVLTFGSSGGKNTSVEISDELKFFKP